MERTTSERLLLIDIRDFQNNLHSIINKHASSALKPNPRLANPKTHQQQVDKLTKAVKAWRSALEEPKKTGEAQAAMAFGQAMKEVKRNALVALKAVYDSHRPDVDFIYDHYEASKSVETVESDLL